MAAILENEFVYAQQNTRSTEFIKEKRNLMFTNKNDTQILPHV